MELIVGLGNIGKEFDNTRHNSGFMFADTLYSKLVDLCSRGADFIFAGEKLAGGNLRLSDWDFEKDYNSDMAYLFEGSQRILALMKPRTYMNDAGKVIKKFMEKNTVTYSDLTIVYDDMDIKLGSFKMANTKSPKGHNGVIDIEKHLKTLDFTHVRLGVDSRSAEYRIPGLDYVLMKMKSDELSLHLDTIRKAVDQLLS